MNEMYVPVKAKHISQICYHMLVASIFLRQLKDWDLQIRTWTMEEYDSGLEKAIQI